MCHFWVPLFEQKINFVVSFLVKSQVVINRPFSDSEKESESSDILLHFVKFSNVFNCDRDCNSTRSNLEYKCV